MTALPEVISQLGQTRPPQHIGGIVRTFVMHRKNTQKSLQQTGRARVVQYIVEASLRHDSDKVRISTQLIQLKNHTHLWSTQYYRALGGLLAVTGEIAREVADEIKAVLGIPMRADTAFRNNSLYARHWFLLKI